MRVPIFKEEPYYDNPTSASFAKPVTQEEIAALRSPVIVDRKQGQQLEGIMIPTR